MGKNSIVLIANKSPITKVKIFHYYFTKSYNISTIGSFTLGSIRSLKSNKVFQLKKRTKLKNIIVRTRQWILRKDTTKRKYFSNSIVILKKNFLPLSKYMIGSTTIDLKRKKYISYFLEIF